MARAAPSWDGSSGTRSGAAGSEAGWIGQKAKTPPTPSYKKCQYIMWFFRTPKEEHPKNFLNPKSDFFWLCFSLSSLGPPCHRFIASKMHGMLKFFHEVFQVPLPLSRCRSQALDGLDRGAAGRRMKLYTGLEYCLVIVCMTGCDCYLSGPM